VPWRRRNARRQARARGPGGGGSIFPRVNARCAAGRGKRGVCASAGRAP
jgi:hypothetical protein